MKNPSHLIRLASFLAIAATVACADARVKKLSEGISRDSVLTILRDGQAKTATDSMQHVYEAAAYLVNGVRYDVVYYTKGEELAGVDSVPPKQLTPIVLQNDSVTGWGWEHWDSVARVLKVTLPPR
jgi:hypothetical protein